MVDDLALFVCLAHATFARVDTFPIEAGLLGGALVVAGATDH